VDVETRARGALTNEAVKRLINAIKPKRITSRTDPVFEKRVKKWGDKELKKLGVKATFNMYDPKVVDFLHDLSNSRFGSMNDTTQKKIRNALAKGVEAGEGAEKLAKRIQKVFGFMKKSRALKIARTETVRASNFGTYESFRQSGVVDWKRWLATRDSRTRQTHAAMDGQLQKLKAPFKLKSGRHVGKGTQYPGGFGIPSEDIHCRCTLIAVTGKAYFVERELYAMWRAYDRELIPWEREVYRAVSKGFALQEKDVLARLAKELA
jgi:SPP1 gp7 family putative phage head morphogenesis protein